MKKSTIIIIVVVIAVAAAAAWYFLVRKTTESKKKALNSWAPTPTWDKMTDEEISDCYKFFKKYPDNGAKMPTTDPLWSKIDAISKKYNIFT